MTIKERIKKKIVSLLGLASSSGDTVPNEDRITLINDTESQKIAKIQEYCIWYYGDEEELLNYYTYNNMVNFNYEPYYSRNKRSYFWSISSTETDIKRTHSGQPRNIVDTLVSILRFPLIGSKSVIDDKHNRVDVNLKRIIKESGLERIYKNKQLPLTLVEGWGCYKINWDKDISDYPYLTYYRAENVDFVYKGGKIIGCIFKDYYTDGESKKYMLIETRSFKRDEENNCRNLVIKKELFITDQKGLSAKKVDFAEVPELQDVVPYIELGPCDFLLAVPSVLFEDASGLGMHGRSIFTGKVGLFDDLDQCLSQAANAVRSSTVREYFNTDFLERDRDTGMPKQPKVYDRKYTMYSGVRGAEGESVSKEPVQVTQPNVNFQQYSDHAKEILMQIINGVMSPATLGIDVSRKDNAMAQREKEKVTIFTRNSIIDAESEILKDVCNQLLCAYEFMTTGKMTVREYDISVKFSEFADDSFENKLKELSAAFNSETMSEKMFMNKLYGDTLSPEEYEEEFNWLVEHHTEPKDEGMLGAAGGGANLPGMMDNQGVDTEDYEEL